MRMWMVDTKILCRKHLLGEHVEHHMFLGSLQKGVSMRGYLANNLFEPRSLQIRHDALATELTRRGYKHKSPLLVQEKDIVDQPDVLVDVLLSLQDLLSRCPECKKRYEEAMNDSR